MSKAKQLLDICKEAKEDKVHGIRLDSMGVFLKPGPTRKTRSGPKEIDVLVDMTGFQDPGHKAQWRNPKYTVVDPLDLSAADAAKSEIQAAILIAAKAFDSALDAEMAKIGFKKETE